MYVAAVWYFTLPHKSPWWRRLYGVEPYENHYSHLRTVLILVTYMVFISVFLRGLT